MTAAQLMVMSIGILIPALNVFAGAALDQAKPNGGNAEWRMRHGIACDRLGRDNHVTSALSQFPDQSPAAAIPVRPASSRGDRRRNIVERLIGWLKESRRVFSRFEETARNFVGMIKMAFIHRYLRSVTK